MGIEIIPNFHPIFVHFSVALFFISVFLYLAGFILKDKKKKQSFLMVARWNLCLGALFTIVTVAAGFDAYYTVIHDAPSHDAMKDHRNWAVPTAIIFGALALWAFLKQRDIKTVSSIFIVLIIFASGLLGTVAYKGGEVVYRYGVGVMSLPNAICHHNDHSDHHHHE